MRVILERTIQEAKDKINKVNLHVKFKTASMSLVYLETCSN